MTHQRVEVLLVRGAPGVGKSSAVKALRRSIPEGAIIEVDDLRAMIAQVRWKDLEHHKIGLAHAKLLLESFRSINFCPIVVVDTYSRGLADPFARSLCRSYQIASLVADTDTLEERVCGRPLHAFRELPACVTLNNETRRDRFEHDTLVDTTKLSVDQVADRLFDLVREER